MHVTALRYQPIEGGGLGGHFALHVALGGGDTPGADLSPTELATRIHDCYEKLAITHKGPKGVLFDCRLVFDAAEDMRSLLGTLRDWGLNIILWVREETRYSWFEFANYITVFVHSPHWPNFKVSEIRYVPDPSGLLEPEVFEVNSNASLYLVPPVKSVSAKDILSFITSAKRLWGVIQPVKFTLSIDFKLE